MNDFEALTKIKHSLEMDLQRATENIKAQIDDVEKKMSETRIKILLEDGLLKRNKWILDKPDAISRSYLKIAKKDEGIEDILSPFEAVAIAEEIYIKKATFYGVLIHGFVEDLLEFAQKYELEIIEEL